MSEDSRSTKPKKKLYVANPGSGESDDGKDNRGGRPNGNGKYNMNGTRNLLPPSGSSYTYLQHRPSPSQPNLLTTDLYAVNNRYHQPQPISPVSTGSPSTPPSTPGLHAPSSSVELQTKLDSPSKPLPTPEPTPYHDRTHYDPPPHHQSAAARKGSKILKTLKAPFGGRPLSKSTADPNHPPRRPRTSPTTGQDAYPSPSTSAAAERVIFVTSDSERYVTVDLTGQRTAAQIRELILSKLHIYTDDETNPYLIFQTEIGAYALGDALTNDRLVAMCRDQADSKGSLKFLVTHPFAPVHEPPPPSQPVEYTPIPPVHPQLVNINPLRLKRRSGSRNGSFSSTSEILVPEVSAGYEADIDYPDREATKPSVRPSHPHLAASLPTQAPHPPSPHRRPSLANQARPSSPVQPDQPTSPPPSSERTMLQRKDEKYGHALPPIPVAPPLSPNRPSFPVNDESSSSLTIPHDRNLHARSGSDAGADREMAMRATELYPENGGRQLRSQNHYPSLQKLRPELSRDNLRLQSQSRKTYDDEDVSQEIIMPSGGRPTDELDRISPSLTRSRRHQNSTNGYRPTSPYTQRSHIMNNPPRQPPPVPSTSQDSRPLNKPRAHLPIATSVFVNWKGEEGGSRKTSAASSTPSWQGNRLGKNMTKSMDNLKLSSVSSSSSSRRNQPPPQLPMTVSRPGANMRDLSYSPSSTLALSGMPKSYEPPRGFVRPLPVQGSPHGTSPEVLQGSSSQYNNSRGGGYSSTLMSPSQDPYPRPQSAAGDTISPTRAYPRMQSPTVYGSTLDSGEFNRSPRTVSPNSRTYHSPGLIPGPRPKPTHYSDRSDRSSDVQSGPETSNTTPPRTPVSPQSSQHEERARYVEDPSPPLSPENPTNLISKDRSSELTVKQEDQKYISSIFQATSTGTFVLPPSQQPRPTRQLTPPPPLASKTSTSSDAYGPDDGDDDDDSDNGGGTWIVRPEPAKNAARPPLKVQIDPTGSRNGDSGTADSQVRPEPLSKDLPPSSYRLAPSTALRLQPRRPESTFIDPGGDNWAPRPPPENIYDHLEKFFPKHDLDKPVIEATSGDTSPITAEPTAALPPPMPISDTRARIRAKKSIRIVAQEHKKLIDRTSRAADAISHTDNMLRKRSTKLWGSKLEEVTTLQGRNNSNISLPESPSGGPTTFKWVRGELIGKGTYGRVYLALNATTGEMIAVKQVELPQTASDKNDSRQHTVVQALKMESETLRDLDHPHIVQYLGFEETPANLSIFLEYVPGGSVGSCLHKHGKFADNVTRSFTAQILSGLEYLHSKGILHRDLKADNILVEMSGTCKISDFGISKRTEDLAGGAFTAMQGTVFWMAPEVINTQKKGYNFKIDIWSVGCVVLEMWAGMRPWIGEEMVAVMFKLYQSKQPPPVPEDIVLSEEADDFRRKCFAINPEERPSAAELRKHPYLILPPGWVFTGFT